MMKITHFDCPNCRHMSPFDEKLPVQKCESCGKDIVICPKCEGDGTDGAWDLNDCGCCNGKGLIVNE